jgi:hypothetical protein
MIWPGKFPEKEIQMKNNNKKLIIGTFKYK